jgi:adhesin transport system membrane fusion protein
MSAENDKKSEPWLPPEGAAAPGGAATSDASQMQVQIQPQAQQPGTQSASAPQAQTQVQFQAQPQSGAKPFSGGRSGGPAAPPAGAPPNEPPRLFVGTREEQPLPRMSWVIWLIAAALLTLLAWAWFFKLDEVSTGTGKVVPSSREQEIQSQDGGTLRQLLVKEGDIVEAGQVLARFDPVRARAGQEESAARLRAALATAARLTAQVNGSKLTFPSEVQEDENLVRSETRLYDQSTSGLQKTLGDFDNQIQLAQNELRLTEPLVAQGAASEVEVLRLKSRIADLQTRRNSAYNDYYMKGREELARANAEVDSQRAIISGRSEVVQRTTITSPVHGQVKDIAVTTIGGVIPSWGKLMSIVPLDDQLLVEARISPRDIAYIKKGLEATVKFTAYDYAIYGGLKGTVTGVSPDTIQDEVKRDVYYYRVYVTTKEDHLKNKVGKKFPITPGMIATVDIHTGEKSVLDYLIKPLNRGREALRER